MSVSKEDLPQLVMYADLTHLPDLVLPVVVSVCSLEGLPGGEKAWEEIISTAFGTPYDFDEYLKKDPAFKPERVMFACADGRPAATACAWYRENYGPETGYIHMVGALPEYKGRGLGYIICLAALLKLREEGFSRAVLTTDDFRLPAIKTYLKLGFEVNLSSHESIPARWGDIMGKLKL